MYSTCLYCSKDFGTNDVLETLPVGRRIAFDARLGRLWVVCRKCEKWNLVPFDTRLETIDACERLFSEARLRYSTDNIGIARLSEGLELVRIGPALRPEFAAWRYGDQFGRRRRRTIAGMAAAGVFGVGFVVAGHTIFPILAGAGFGGQQVFTWGTVVYSHRRAAVHVPERDGVGGMLTQMNVAKAEIVTHGAGSSWSLRLKLHQSGAAGFVKGLRGKDTDLQGQHAIDTLGRLLPRLTPYGGSKRTIGHAVDLVEGYGDVDGILAVHHRAGATTPTSGRLKYFDPRVRLALEMAAHEDTERALLAGELKLLEREWKAADALAKIADTLAVSDDVRAQTDDRAL